MTELSTRGDTADILSRFLSAVKQRDLDAVMTLVAEDCVVESMTSGGLAGRQGMRHLFGEWLAAFPDLAVHAEETIVDGDRGVLVLTLAGTDLGGFMSLPATGKSFRLSCVMVFTIAGRQVVRYRKRVRFHRPAGAGRHSQGETCGMNQSGWHFLQIPGPTNVPDRVLRAMARPTIDHRGQEFAALTLELIAGLQRVFGTREPVVIYPGSGSGASEAAYVNTLSPGDRVIVFETGHFALQWKKIAERLGLRVDYVPGNWRRGASEVELESRLAADTAHEVKAVVVVHNETSTGVASRIPDLRKAMDRAKHPALLIVDAVSSLASMDYRHDEWGVDVTVCGSQKGLMVPPGMGFCAVSKKARAAARDARLARAYFDWDEIITQNEKGFFPYTPATNLFYGLREALQMLEEEGMANVLARHARHGEATRAAVRAWGLEIVCEDPREYSNSMTAVFMPDGHNADTLRSVILEQFNMSLGIGLSKFSGRVFRIGHLGSFNDLMLAGTLSGVEMGMRVAGVPHREGGVQAALTSLATSLRSSSQEAAHAR